MEEPCFKPYYPFYLVFVLFTCCPCFLCGERVDVINFQPNQTAPDGGIVAGLWSQWNESKHMNIVDVVTI